MATNEGCYFNSEDEMLKLTKEEIELRLANDADFIDMPRYGNSIQKLLVKHPNGCENGMVAKALHMTPEEVEETFKRAVAKLQESLKIGEE